MMIESVLEEFNFRTDSKITPLGNAGGFSGSEIWRIDSPLRGTFCLKRWPRQFQDQSRIEWIHKVLIFASINGCPEIAKPINTRSQKSFHYQYETIWEMTAWADGEVISPNSLNEKQVESAIETLARFHQATARYFFNFAPSNKIVEVRDQLLGLPVTLAAIDQHKNELASYLRQEQWLEFKTQSPGLALDIARFLLPFSSTVFPVQPVIRDMRPDHLFFTENRVTGLVDFGAMKVDTVACDLSRLLGGLFEDDAHRFQKSINDYSNHRQIFPHEREVILPLNHASVVLGIANWLKWIAVDKIRFYSPNDVGARINSLMRRFTQY